MTYNHPHSYPRELKEGVLRFISDNPHIAKRFVSEKFGVPPERIYIWLNKEKYNGYQKKYYAKRKRKEKLRMQSRTGNIEMNNELPKYPKELKDEIREHVKTFPDLSYAEIAEHFNVPCSNIYVWAPVEEYRPNTYNAKRYAPISKPFTIDVAPERKPIRHTEDLFHPTVQRNEEPKPCALCEEFKARLTAVGEDHKNLQKAFTDLTEMLATYKSLVKNQNLLIDKLTK